jgi:hypothetical protein
MLKTFIRGCNYFTTKKRLVRRKKPTTRGCFRTTKNIFKRRLKRSLYALKSKSKVVVRRKKYLSASYFRRYLFEKKSFLYKRTIGNNCYHIFDYQEEINNLIKLRHDLSRQERNKMLNTQMIFRSSFKPLYQRVFSFGRVYLTHRRRNTFITINQISEYLFRPVERVIFKSSCGLLDYKGPKRGTHYARIAVAKRASNFMAQQQLTSVDLIFPSRISRFFTRILSALNQNQIYVRYMIVPKRRAHGLTRQKKKCRK